MKQNKKLSLPIDQYLPEILTAARNYSTILLKASPGSGKTTRLPYALARFLNKKVAVLEPRKLAAKLAATRIAFEENLTLGQEVGYHFRFEKKSTDQSHLVFYTEGTFLKKFLNDSKLIDYDVIILDEFHERHLETDLTLALLRGLQKKKSDLKIILMSATFDTKIEEAFFNPIVFNIEAPLYPVDVSYLPNQPSVLNESLELKVKKAVQRAGTEGDILVFLPGMREMLRVKELLKGNIYLLHADLSKEEQKEALEPSDIQKVILATNIAESSVTIPGIRTVIDSGIQREAFYSPWSGLKIIRDVPITKSSAIQRAGRAGRTGPGICLRLYAEMDFLEREEHTVPEIKRADLTDVYLLSKGSDLNPLWFETPPVEKWQKAKNLLEMMGAIESDKLTLTGKEMLEIPLESRLSRILVSGKDLSVKSKEQLLRFICHDIEKDHSGILMRRLASYLKSGGHETNWEKHLLSGFIDQLGKFRSKQRDFIHYSGKSIKAHHSLQCDSEYCLILDITQKQEAIKIFPIEEEWLWEHNPFPFTEEDEIQIDEKILIKHKTKIGSIVIEETVKKPTHEDSQVLKGKIYQLAENFMLHKIHKWQKTNVYERMLFWAKLNDLDLDNILKKINPTGYFNYSQTFDWDHFEFYLLDSLKESLNLQDMDHHLPVKISLAGKRELIVYYPSGMDPYLEAPIQDFYGLNETPTIMKGKVPLTIKLLGPHKRPIQVTKDLKGFWQNTYPDMKKQYQRDYPRHHWPEDPIKAQPILLKRQLPKV